MEEVRIRITMQKPYGPCGDVWTPDVIVFDTDEGMQTLYDRMKTTAMSPLTIPLRTAMTEDEMLRRAREAVIAIEPDNSPATNAAIRRGDEDPTRTVKAALHALRNLDKPLPVPIEPVVLKAREIVAKYMGHACSAADVLAGKRDETKVMSAVLEALRHD